MILEAPPPFRLAAVVLSHGWFQTRPFDWEGSVLRRVECLPGGLARLDIVEQGGGVRVGADRTLSADEESELARRVRRMLQLDRDLGGFLEALAFDPGLAADLDAYGAGRLLAGASLWEDVVKAICGTNVTWTQAVSMIDRIAGWGVDECFPAPEAVLAGGEERLRGEARVGYRAPFVLAAARAALDGTLAAIEREAHALDGDALAERLRSLPGIGPQTAGFLCLLMGHYDRVVVDSATVRHAATVWFEGRRPTPAEILGRVETAGPWRGLALYWAMMRAWHRETGLQPVP